MFVRVSIETGASRTVAIADTALVWRNGEPAVFVVDPDGKVAARDVETGTRSGGRVAITSGLAEGETVVVVGAGFLSEGSIVRVAANDSSKATKAETIR
jgi:multidrug efflux pump subunit AcrA (membrane-fusion protein)